jgi:hypothetical protein
MCDRTFEHWLLLGSRFHSIILLTKIVLYVFIMKLIRFFPHKLAITALVTLLLIVGLSLKEPVRVQAQSSNASISSQLPDQWESAPLPNSGDSGLQDSSNLPFAGCLSSYPIALVPASGMGQTLAEYPTIFWYLPRTRAWGMEFKLTDSDNQEIYSTKYAFARGTSNDYQGQDDQLVVGTPGILSLTIPRLTGSSLPLKEDQKYDWTVRIICNPNDLSGDVYMAGTIRRVSIDPTLSRRLQQAPPEERVVLYAKERLWYEALGTLVKLHRDRPNDPAVIAAWDKLLKSVGLDMILLG